MDSSRTTLYRVDSLGGEQDHRNRTRPRSYSFADLIEEEEDIQTKAARTKTVTEITHKKLAHGLRFVEGIKNEEKSALEQFFPPATSSILMRDEEAFFRNDTIETQPSLSTSFDLASFQAEGTVPTSFGEHLQKVREGDDQQENEVIELEERAPPIAENGKLEHVNVHMQVGSEGVTVFLEVSLEVGGARDRGLEATGSPTPHQDNGVGEEKEKRRKRRKKKKIANQEKVDVENRTPWSVGASSPAPIKAKVKPKTHKVLESEKKLTYSKKRELLLSHLRSVNSSYEKNSMKSPERARTPEAAPLRKRAQPRVSPIGEADSYLAALDNAKRAKQLNADRLSPKTVKPIPKVMDRSSDYKKRYGRLSPKNAASRWRAKASGVGQTEGSPVTEVVSLKLTELFYDTREKKSKERETKSKTEVAKANKHESESEDDVLSSASSIPSTPTTPKSPPPVEMSFKLSDLGISVAGITVQAVQKFKSFKSTKYTAKDGPVGVVDKEDPAEEIINEEGESSSDLDVKETSVDNNNDGNVQRGDHLDQDEVNQALAAFADEEERGGSSGEGEKIQEENGEQQQVSGRAASGATEIEEEEVGDKAQSQQGTVKEGIDPLIVDYFMQHEEEKLQGADAGKAKKKKKKIRIKKFFGKVFCRKKKT